MIHNEPSCHHVMEGIALWKRKCFSNITRLALMLGAIPTFHVISLATIFAHSLVRFFWKNLLIGFQKITMGRQSRYSQGILFHKRRQAVSLWSPITKAAICRVLQRMAVNNQRLLTFLRKKLQGLSNSNTSLVPFVIMFVLWQTRLMYIVIFRIMLYLIITYWSTTTRNLTYPNYTDNMPFYNPDSPTLPLTYKFQFCQIKIDE